MLHKGQRISVVATTRHATHAKGSKGVSAAYKGGCTHGMHNGGGKVDRGAHGGLGGGGVEALVSHFMNND